MTYIEKLFLFPYIMEAGVCVPKLTQIVEATVFYNMIV